MKKIKEKPGDDAIFMFEHPTYENVVGTRDPVWYCHIDGAIAGPFKTAEIARDMLKEAIEEVKRELEPISELH